MFFFWLMFCLIVLTTNKMSIYNNKDIITSEIVWIRQLFFPMLLFYHNVKFQLCLISDIHMLILFDKTKVICINNFQYLHIPQFYMPCYTQQDSTCNHRYKNCHHLILYTHTNIHHDSIFASNCIHFHSMQIFTLSQFMSN